MIAKIFTKLNFTDVQLQSEIIKPQTLQYIAEPLLCFIPINNDEPFNEWVVGKTYKFKIFLLKYISLGRHDIKIAVIDKKQTELKLKNLAFCRRLGTIVYGLITPAMDQNIPIKLK